MKRIILLAVMAAFVLGLASMASAVELKWKGEYRFAAKWADNWDFYDGDEDGDSEDDFGARQRFRLQTDFIASELLKGVFYIESGETVWGGNGAANPGKGSGGALGSDGVSIEVRRAYVEFMLPDTNLTFKVGIQGFALPSTDLGPPVLGGTGTDMAGVVASLKISDEVSLAGVWFRPMDDDGDIVSDSPAADEIDVFGLVAPLAFDGVSLAPYVAAAFSGKDAALDGLTSNNGLSNEDAVTWWLGASFELSMMDPLWFGLDAVYGTTSADEDDEDRAGWLVQAEVNYDLGMVTPSLAVWYATGDDDDDDNGSEVLPVIDPAFFGTSFGFDGYDALGGGDLVNYNALATWGVAFALKDISFVEDLTHTLRIAYVRGTHDEDAAYDFAGESTALTTEDSAWEVNFDHNYQIFEELSLGVEMGWICLELDEDVWNDDTSDAWKLGFQLKYSF